MRTDTSHHLATQLHGLWQLLAPKAEPVLLCTSPSGAAVCCVPRPGAALTPQSSTSCTAPGCRDTAEPGPPSTTRWDAGSRAHISSAFVATTYRLYEQQATNWCHISQAIFLLSQSGVISSFTILLHIWKNLFFLWQGSARTLPCSSTMPSAASGAGRYL